MATKNTERKQNWKEVGKRVGESIQFVEREKRLKKGVDKLNERW